MRDGSPFPGYWTMDYPRSDRHLLAGIRRLTRIDTRSIEQVVTLDGTDDVYNWPVLYGVEVGHWNLGDAEAKQLREYLLRGGFFMCDDFHGTEPYHGVPEWDTFMRSMSMVFPDRQIEDIPDNDPIFHTLFDLQDRFQVPGAQFFDTGLTYEDGETGKVPHWRCIRDDKGRIMVAICHNMDLGDAWEWADDPRVSGEVGVTGVSHRGQLFRLRFDALGPLSQSWLGLLSRASASGWSEAGGANPEAFGPGSTGRDALQVLEESRVRQVEAVGEAGHGLEAHDVARPRARRRPRSEISGRTGRKLSGHSLRARIRRWRPRHRTRRPTGVRRAEWDRAKSTGLVSPVGISFGEST